MPPLTPQVRTPLRALVASVAALVLVAGNLAALHHVATVQHVVCVEHGDLVHVPEGQAAHGHGHAHDHDHDLVDAADRSTSWSAPGHVDDHDHCLLISATRDEDDACLGGAGAAALPLTLHAVAGLPAVDAPAPVAPLHGAPKTSPPV